MKKKIFILILLIIVFIIGYNYIYQNHRNIEKEKPAFALTADTIADKFLNNQVEASSVFLNQTIELNGTVTEVNIRDITLDNKVFCQFSKDIKPKIEISDKIVIKGRCIGFDDLLEQVKFDQCSLIK